MEGREERRRDKQGDFRPSVRLDLHRCLQGRELGLGDLDDGRRGSGERRTRRLEVEDEGFVSAFSQSSS